jgi:hypothetical protein
MTTGIVDPLYNLSERFALDSSEESRSWLRVYEETSGGSKMNNNPVQRTLLFRVDDLQSWIALGRSYINFRCKIDNAGYNATTRGKCFINGFHKAVRRATLRFNGQTINQYHQYAREHMNIEDILSFNEDFQRSDGSNMGYIPEMSQPLNAQIQSGEHKLAPVVEDGILEVANPSFALRQYDQMRSANGGGREMNFSVPLHKYFAFLKTWDHTIRGVQVEVELELSDDAEILCHDPTDVGGQQNNPLPPSFKWVGAGATLFVDRRVPALSVRNSLNQMLANGFQLNGYEFVDHVTYRKAFDAVSGGEDFHVSTSVSKVLRIYVMCQLQERLTSSEYNNTVYDRCFVKRLSVSVNGSPSPLEAYQLEWNDDLYTDRRGDRKRAYNDLLKSQGLDVSPMSDKLNSGTLTYNDWRDHYPIYVIDLNNMVDTEFVGSSEVTVNFERTAPAVGGGALDPAGAFHMYVCIEHLRYANISLSNTDSQVVVS